MLDLDDLGRAEGRELGPRPGQGAVVYHCSGEADFDGLPDDELQAREAGKRKLNVAGPRGCNAPQDTLRPLEN